MLDYGQYSRRDADGTFRFTGGFESITDRHTLWIRSEDLTVPVSLENAETYLLPMQNSENLPEILDPGDESPEKIRWERVSALTEGARVFVGGPLVYRDGRWGFVSTKEQPLLVIFYDGMDHSLTARAIRAGRHRGEYWNAITPYSLIAGAIGNILMALNFLSRPAFRLTVIVSLIALFIPLYPIIPPGLLCTLVYRRLSWRSRMLRAYRDLARLPLCYLSPRGKRNQLNERCVLPNGEEYGYRCVTLPPQDGTIPQLLPEFTPASGDSWYIFGALRPGEELPVQPQDPFATFGILPGRPEKLARRYEISAYIMELVAWAVLCLGIGLNIFFLRLVLILL